MKKLLSVIIVSIIILYVCTGPKEKKHLREYFLQRCSDALENKNADSFFVLGEKYIKDWESVYWVGDNSPCKFDKIEGEDVDSFEILGTNNRLGFYGKDKTSVYFADKKIEGADVDTFGTLAGENTWNYYLRDKNNVYFSGRKVDGADPDTFEEEFTYHGFDKDYIYLCENRIEGSDAKSYESFGSSTGFHGFFKDNNNVYHWANCDWLKIVEGVDPITFEALGSEYYRDNNSVFWEEDKIEGADRSTFEVIDSQYSKDKNFVYFRGNKIGEADVNTFEVSGCPNPTQYAEDENYSYENGEITGDMPQAIEAK